MIALHGLPPTHPELQKLRLLFVAFGTLMITVIFINMYAISASIVPDTSVQYELSGAENSIQSMAMWPKIIAASRLPISYDKTSKDSKDFDLLYLHDCWQDEDWLRMYLDPYCMFLWMQTLEHGKVSSVSNVLSVITQQERKLGEDSKSNQNGGMRCAMDGHLKDLNIQGYWKPCTTQYLPYNGESFKSEVIAFHIDRILGFYRTPPVVPVNFHVNQLRYFGKEAANRQNFPDPEAVYKIQTVIDKCGTPTGAEGAMVGWSNLPIRVLDRSSKRLKDLRVVNMFNIQPQEIEDLKNGQFNITRESPQHLISWALENVALNMFSVLMGNPQKFSHSVFALQRELASGKIFGPLVYVDNDRSSWNNDIVKRGLISFEHPLAVFCKFPLEIATRILAVNETAGFTVGNIIKESVAPYDSTLKESPLFSDENGKWVDHRVQYLRNIIEKCIHHHGVADVLIPEPWYQEYSGANVWMKDLPGNWLNSFYSNTEINPSLLSMLGFGESVPFQDFDALQYNSKLNWRLNKREFAARHGNL